MTKFKTKLIREYRVPIVPQLHRKVAEAVGPNGTKLCMDLWHCGSTHCRGGWAVTLAGEQGAELDSRAGIEYAAGMIYRASTGMVPDFFASDPDAFADIKARAFAYYPHPVGMHGA